MNSGDMPGGQGEDKVMLASVDSFQAPIGGQEVMLQQVDYVHGGMSLLRIRIREGKRFTIFDVDPVTAARWGGAMSRWAEAQDTKGGSEETGSGETGAGR